MADIDATAVLASANASAIELAAPTDQSLNAGALLPDEPIPDVLTNTVEADAATVVEMIPKLSEPAPESQLVQESIYQGLRYLREDLRKQRGMSQGIATEALSLLPNFGKGRPVNFYSRHPSPTGYQLALEEIEAGMKGDVLGQLNCCAANLLGTAENTSDQDLIEKTQFKRRADQVTMQADILSELIAHCVDKIGFQWDDQTFRGCAVDPSQNAVVPAILSIPRVIPSSFASMDEYYEAHLDAPAMMELMTTHLVQWKRAFETYQASLCAEDQAKFEIPTAPTVYFSFGRKTTKLVNIADVFKSAQDKCREADVGKNTLDWVREIANAAEQAKVDDLFIRAVAFRKALAEVAGIMQSLGAELIACKQTVDAVEPLQKAVEAFDTVSAGMLDAYRQMLLWCLNAALATSFAGVLTARVVDFAWKAINQCKDSMQMPEELYQELQVMVDQLQAPVVANAV